MKKSIFQLLFWPFFDNKGFELQFTSASVVYAHNLAPVLDTCDTLWQEKCITCI